MRQKGFTLIELLIIIAVLGILAAITIPAFIGFTRVNHTERYKQEKSQLTESDFQIICLNGVEYYFTERGYLLTPKFIAEGNTIKIVPCRAEKQ
jgi:type IV pilus assembly protein PilA